LRKAKKKRKDETEQDSDSKLDVKQVWRHAQATRRRRMLNSSPRQNSGGGRSPPGGNFIHHNFRYGPEPPAYKAPKPEYPSYPRRETEKPVAHDRHIVREKSVDEKTIDRLIRRFLKDVTESDELPDEEDLLEPKPNKKNDELPDLTSRDLQRVTRILEQQSSRSEFQPIIDFVEKKSKELDEAKFDPERLLKQLQVYPTEELQDKTLAELNRESRFVEEEIEGSKVETDTLPSTKPISKGIDHAETIPRVESEHAKPESDAIPSNKPDIERPLEQTTIDAYSELTQQTLPEIAPTSEAEILDDVQDLMHELEPEIEEQEEVEPSY
jgi:hypothetical protein